ncbi:3-oxoacyl-[acyl-carrier-protein] synthase III C-terminal domain-containing protein [Streptomyces sp. NPDC050619]|uniref:3-oxoacyl-[acyl-carrier-protein] synthase III C-terminal domain-containing protein n=1 Tax=Streptomyces sp. NPDC050619 TaxID=3157214 RepID=UPI003447AE58
MEKGKGEPVGAHTAVLRLVPIASALGGRTALDELPEMASDDPRIYWDLGYRDSRVTDEGNLSLVARALPGELPVTAPTLVVLAIGSQHFSRALPRMLRDAGLRPEKIFDLASPTCGTFLAQVDLAAGMIRGGAASSALAIIAGSADANVPRVRRGEHVQSDGACVFALTGDPVGVPHFVVESLALDYVHPADASRFDEEPNAALRASLKVTLMRSLIREVLKRTDTPAAHVDHLVMQNLGLDRMKAVRALSGVRPEALWLDSLAHNGHVIAADSMVNLQDLYGGGRLATGAKILMVGTSPATNGAMLLRFAGG